MYPRDDLADARNPVNLREDVFIRNIALQGARTSKLLSEMRWGRLTIVPSADALELVKEGR